jgi:hypothetical protein
MIGDCILLLILVRSFLALKKQNGLETCRNVLKISCADPLAIGPAWWLSTVRKGRRFGYVALTGLPITNLSDIVPRPRNDVDSPFTHFSPMPLLNFDALTLAQCMPLTFHR